MPEDTTLTIVCSWCKKPMGTKPGQGVSGETSTICPDCARKEQEALDNESAQE